MKAYTITFPGVYLGAVGVVVARDEEAAIDALIQHVEASGLYPRGMRALPRSKFQVDAGRPLEGVLHFSDGDY